MNTTRAKRELSAVEEKVITELWHRKQGSIPTKGFVTATAPVPMGSKDDNGPWGEKPARIIPAGQTLQIVMISRFDDFGLTDDLAADYGYEVRLDFDDAAITDIRLTLSPSA